MATKITLTVEKKVSSLKLEYLSYMQKWKDYKEMFVGSTEAQIQHWASLGHEEAKMALDYRKDRKAMKKIATQLDTLTNNRG